MTDKPPITNDKDLFTFHRPIKREDLINFVKRLLVKTLRHTSVFEDPATVKSYLMLELGEEEREVFGCAFLDNQHRLISFDRLFYGTINGASVHPREVVKRALAHNAAAVILAHNHPSGVAEPSVADRRITDRIKSALLLIDVRVLDHIIVGDSDTTSFAERGLV